MVRILSIVFSRSLFRVITGVFALCALCVASAEASVKVNCNTGGSIGAVLDANTSVSPLVLVVKGACTENVVIARDDVTIRTNGVALATIVAADITQPAIKLDGARRIVIDGKVANGITVSGGTGISATRGATLTLKNCQVTGVGSNGVTASYNSTLEVDNCNIHDNGGVGIVLANTSSGAVTNSVVQQNGGGITAVRASHVRIGQDLAGSLTLGPVAVSNNNANGVVFTDSSAGILVGSTITGNNGHGVHVSHTSSSLIGVGSNGLIGANVISGNALDGVSVFQGSQGRIQGNTINGNSGAGVSVSGAATITGNTINANGVRGILVFESGNGRIGVTETGTQSGNTINNNTRDGVGVFNGGEALLAGNTISSSTDAGIAVGRATLRMLGGNTVELSGADGVSIEQSRLFQGQGDFTDVPNAPDVVQNNGFRGLNLFNTSSGDVRNMTITTNHRQGISLGLNSSLNLQGTSVTGNATSNVAGENDGIALSSTSVLLTPTPSNLTVSGHPGNGINCFGAEASAAGDFSGVSGNTTNPQVNCSGF